MGGLPGDLRYVRRGPLQTGSLAIRRQQRQTALIAGNQTPVEARRALEQFEGSAQAAFAQTDDEEYETQTRKLSL